MTSGDDGQIRALSKRLDEVRRLYREAWLGGLSVGGGLAFHEQQTRLEEEARTLEARLGELGETPPR